MPQQALVNEVPWSKRAVVLLSCIGGASLLLGFLLLVFRGKEGQPSHGADGYSRSAIGHLTLVQMLKQSGRPVLQSRMAPGEKQRAHGVMVVAEPQFGGEGEVSSDDVERLTDLLAALPRGLLVLPKWRGSEDPAKPGWIASEYLLELAQVQRVLDAASDGDTVEVVRDEALPRWRQDLPQPLPEPTLEGELQLLRTSDVEPVVECRGGALLARIGDLYVLSDPDVLSNQGITDGDNAAFVVGLLDFLRQDGPIVIDETLHGHRQEPSVWEALGRFPLVLLLVHLLLLLAMVLWAAAGRFGAPLLPPRAIAPGKGFLIDNIASLLDGMGRIDAALEQYFHDRLRAASQRLHAPRGLDDIGCLAWLHARAGKDMAVQLDQLSAQVRARPRADRALAVARAIRHWTEEITHGTR